MKTVFLYNGQGAQVVGMGKDLYESFPLAKETFDKADAKVSADFGFSVKEYAFEGPKEKLDLTEHTQACLITYETAVTKILSSIGIKPDIAAGLSLGEYTALFAAGVIGENELIPLVSYRGKIMADAVTGRKVGMTAVLGSDKDTVSKCCKKAEELFKDKVAEGSNEAGLVCSPANFNCPGQIVISGDFDAVEKTSELLKEAGAKRLMPLPVSGPFHTRLMKGAGELLYERLKDVSWGEPTAKVFHNLTALPADRDYPSLLRDQIASSVLFEDTTKNIAAEEPDVIIEIGPGSTVGKFYKKTDANTPVINVSTAADIESIKEKLSQLSA